VLPVYETSCRRVLGITWRCFHLTARPSAALLKLLAKACARLNKDHQGDALCFLFLFPRSHCQIPLNSLAHACGVNLASYFFLHCRFLDHNIAPYSSSLHRHVPR